MRRSIAILCLISLSIPVLAQEVPLPTPPIPDREPEPYQDDEFSQWATDLRRAEIIAVGSLPLTTLYGYLAYGILRFAIHGFAVEYSFLGGPNRVPYTLDENVGVLIAACSASIIIATVDWILGVIEEADG